MGGIGNGGGAVTHPDCRPDNLEAASVLCRSGLDDVTSVVHAIDVGLMLPFYFCARGCMIDGSGPTEIVA